MAEPVRHAAVLGRPIAHSLSPVLHRAAYRALGLAWQYEAIDCGADELTGVLADRADWAGFSCTMPLKRAAIEVADEVTPRAAAVGAANTLLPRRGGGWLADNTDIAGIVATVREAGITPASVTVLGAGGTARALVGVLPDLGITRCAVLVRDPARTKQLRSTADRLGVEIDVAALDDAEALAADLVVSTLPGGAADAFADAGWRRGQAVLDVVYDPWPSALAAGVKRAGATALSGVRMLLHQAAAQVELMTGKPAPVAAMSQELRRTLAK